MNISKMDYKLLEETYKKFINSYEIEKAIDTTKFNQKTYLVAKPNFSYCRYCNRSAPEVSFKTDSHLIPKFLGSKYLLSHFECDNCNSTFKDYENDLANFIGVIRSIAGITGKSNTPKHKSKDLMIFQDEDKVIRFVSPEIVEAIKSGKKQIVVKATKDKFTPLHVYKALLKISLSLVKTDEVESLRSAFEFLTSKESKHYNKVKKSLKIFRVFVPGPSVLEAPHVHLWRRKNIKIEVPDKLVVIHVKNIKYIIPIPLNKNDNHLDGKTLDVPMCPILLPKSYIEKHGDFQFEIIDLSSKEPIIGKDDSVGINISNIKKYSH